MIKRIAENAAYTYVSIYNEVAYFSGLSSDAEESLASQAESILEQYDYHFADLNLHRDHIINAFVMMDTKDDPKVFFDILYRWLPVGAKPAVTAIRADLPGGNQISLSLYVAVGAGQIDRTELPNSAGMLVRYNKMVYFSGQSRDKGLTLHEQTKNVMSDYDRMLVENDLKKENIINGNIFVQNIEMQDEYEQNWINWTYTGHKPSGTMVEGKPLDPKHQLVLGLTFADSPEVLALERINPGNNCCRFVRYNKTAYFTGNTCKDPENTKGVYDQTKAIFSKFCEMFNEFGLEKNNIIICNVFLQNIDDIGMFQKFWNEWTDSNEVPALTVCGTKMLDEKYDLEVAITVADF